MNVLDLEKISIDELFWLLDKLKVTQYQVYRDRGGRDLSRVMTINGVKDWFTIKSDPAPALEFTDPPIDHEFRYTYDTDIETSTCLICGKPKATHA